MVNIIILIMYRKCDIDLCLLKIKKKYRKKTGLTMILKEMNKS